MNNKFWNWLLQSSLENGDGTKKGKMELIFVCEFLHNQNNKKGWNFTKEALRFCLLNNKREILFKSEAIFKQKYFTKAFSAAIDI